MMDFGQGPARQIETKPQIKTKSKFRPRLLVIIALIILGVLAFFTHRILADRNPLPQNIKNQISYKVVYPTSKTGSLSSNGYQYHADLKNLNFTIKYSGMNIVFVEQPAPSSVGSGNQVYYQALGLHPYAQFQSKFGPVALTKFYQSGNLASQGQSAVLVSGGTLVIAHPDKDLTNNQWKDLFDSLKISK